MATATALARSVRFFRAIFYAACTGHALLQVLFIWSCETHEGETKTNNTPRHVQFVFLHGLYSKTRDSELRWGKPRRILRAEVTKP